MRTYISLLRGINVGGHKKIAMADLKNLYETLGFCAVRTYIQSGNLIFAAETDDTTALSKKIAQAITTRYHFDVSVIIRTAEEWADIVLNNPFLKENDVELDKLLVIFLEDLPKADWQTSIPTETYLPDKFIAQGKEIYLHCPNGYGRTKLSNNFFERKLKINATTRNQNTLVMINKLMEDY